MSAIGLDSVSKKITVLDKTEYSVYLGELAVLPDSTPRDEPLIAGDYFLAALTFIADGVSYSAGVPYVLTASSNWSVLNSSDTKYSVKMLECLAGVLKSGIAVPSTSALYAWFENLAAQNAVIENLFSKTITINSSGMIISNGYDPGVNGFKLSSDGFISAVAASFKDCFLSGKLSIEATDGSGGMLLKTQYGQTGNSSSISATAWNTKDLSVSRKSDQTISYNGISYDILAEISKGYYSSYFSFYPKGFDFCQLSKEETGSQSLEIKIAGEYQCGSDGLEDGHFKVYKNDSLVFSGNGYGIVTCSIGDIIRIEMIKNDVWAKSYGYFFATNFSDGLFFSSSDFATQVYLLEQYIPSTTALIITSPTEGYSWTSNDHLYYSLPDSWVTLFTDGSSSNINDSIISVGGVSKTAKYGARTGNSLAISFSDGSSLTVASGTYCYASGTIVLLSESRGLKTDRLLPMNSDITDIGTPADKFNNLYANTLNGNQINGNVNVLGTGNQVWGAVAN